MCLVCVIRAKLQVQIPWRPVGCFERPSRWRRFPRRQSGRRRRRWWVDDISNGSQVWSIVFSLLHCARWEIYPPWQRMVTDSLFEVHRWSFLSLIKVITTPVDSCSPVVVWAPHCPWTCRGLFPCSLAKSERRRKRRRRNPSGQRSERPTPLQSCQHQSPPEPRIDNERVKISEWIQSLL